MRGAGEALWREDTGIERALRRPRAGMGRARRPRMEVERAGEALHPQSSIDERDSDSKGWELAANAKKIKI